MYYARPGHYTYHSTDKCPSLGHQIALPIAAEQLLISDRYMPCTICRPIPPVPTVIWGEKGDPGPAGKSPCTIWNYVTASRWKDPLWFDRYTGLGDFELPDGLWYADIPAGLGGQYVFSEGAWREAINVDKVIAIFYGNSLAELRKIIIDQAVANGTVERIEK